MKTKYILEAIRQYIKEERTEYAIIINGVWGSGKTHLWKTKIEPTIKMDYFGHIKKPVYISLYGVQTKEEIDSLITKNSLRLLRFKFFNHLYSLFFSLCNQYVDTNNLHSILRTKNLVLCIDDLERCLMDMQSVLGYINKFVEHENIKVIILCNEVEILDKDKYDKTKEKLIGYTYDFEPDLNSVIKDDVIYNFKHSGVLEKHFDVIARFIVTSKCLNVRTFERCFQVCDEIFDQKKPEDDDLDQSLLYLSLILTDEFKSGRTFDSNLDELLAGKVNTISLLSVDRDDKLRYIKGLIVKHYNGNGDAIPKFLSLYNFITTGYFSVNQFEDELRIHYSKMEDHIVSAKDLFFGEFWKLEDSEINRIAHDIVSDLRNQNILEAAEILSIAQRLFFFSKERIINSTTSELKDVFINSLDTLYDNNVLKFDKLRMLGGPISINDIDLEEYKAVKNHLFNLKERFGTYNFEQESVKLLDLIGTAPDSFFREMYETNKYLTTPIFKFYDPDKLFKNLIEANPDTILNFSAFIESHYTSGLENHLLPDLDVLIKLQELLKGHVPAISLGAKMYAFKHLLSKLQEAITNLERAKNGNAP